MKPAMMKEALAQLSLWYPHSRYCATPLLGVLLIHKQDTRSTRL